GGKDGEVKIELGRDGACAWLRVADRGPGVPPGDEERIFDDFYRARFEDHGVQGAGLGLSIARRLARAMEGDIVLERGRRGGASFLVKLRAAKVPSTASAGDVDAARREPTKTGDAPACAPLSTPGEERNAWAGAGAGTRRGRGFFSSRTTRRSARRSRRSFGSKATA